jgi:hypothetical protein
MNPYAEVGLPTIDTGIETGLETELAEGMDRTAYTAVPVLDNFIGGFPAGKVTLIDSSDQLALDLVHLLCVNEVTELGQEVVWVDGGNSVNPYALSALCKRFHLDTHEVLESVNVSRAFTAYQFVTLIDEMLEAEVERTKAGLVVISSFPDLFLDKDMWWSEAYQLMKRCVAAIQDTTRRHGTTTVVTNLGLSKMLYKKSLRSLVYGSADKVVRIENTKSALKIELVNDGRAMMYHPVPYYQLTLDEFLR